MTNYPLGDFLIRLKNASLARKREVIVVKSKIVLSLAEKLKQLGFLSEVDKKDGFLEVKLTYQNKEPVLADVKLVSKPGLRVYMSADDLVKEKGPYILIISTSKGLMSGAEAIKKRLGGEVIARIL